MYNVYSQITIYRAYQYSLVTLSRVHAHLNISNITQNLERKRGKRSTIELMENNDSTSIHQNNYFEAHECAFPFP